MPEWEARRGGMRMRRTELPHALVLLAAALLSSHLSRAADATPDAMTADAAGPTRERTQLLQELGVPGWHAAGFRGLGVKIAILDTGFRGYQAHLGTALPRKVTTRSFRADGNFEARDSQHGILCAEVIHTLAPDAELLLANWDMDQPRQFLDAVRWAHDLGAKLISCSVIMPSWSDGEGHGPIHQELRRLLGPGNVAGDLLCFASAGNVAQRHWFGTFRRGADGWHEWAPGKTANIVEPWASGEPVSVELYGHSGLSFTLSVTDAATGREIARGACRTAGEASWAVARFEPVADHRYLVRVRQAEGRPGTFHLVALGGTLGTSTARGSVAFPADGPEVVAVGAVDHEGHRAVYSSCGSSNTLSKPALVAPVPFPSAWRARPFSGTSAAAPQAAALAALIWSRRPNWTAEQVRETLRKWARDLGPAGYDEETGYGEIRLPE